MNTFEQILKVASTLKQAGDYKAFNILRPIIADLACLEEKKFLKEKFIQARNDLEDLKTKLKQVSLHKIAKDVDVISQDIEQKIIMFTIEDPIQSILDSYSAIHKIAKVSKTAENEIFNDILQLVESEDYSDSELINEIKNRTLGMTLNDKKRLLYILQKDYNFSIPLEKIAKKEDGEETDFAPSIKPKKPLTEMTDEERKCLEEAKSLKEKIKCVKDSKDMDPTEEKMKMYRSWQSAPNIWTGFAYETTIPYHQSNQINYWSLASTDELKTLNKIAKIK